MAITNIRSIHSGNTKSKIPVEVKFDNMTMTVNQAELDLCANQSALDNLLATKNAPSIYLHLNRSGTIAVATKQVPNVWPEDEQWRS